MPTYCLAGRRVDLPHEAHGPQLVFMEEVIRCLDSRENALLVAPAGSGKSSAVLCAALAWQAEQAEQHRRHKMAGAAAT